ncbi:unnamed protein product [Diplocarpon coronariae]
MEIPSKPRGDRGSMLLPPVPAPIRNAPRRTVTSRRAGCLKIMPRNQHPMMAAQKNKMPVILFDKNREFHLPEPEPGSGVQLDNRKSGFGIPFPTPQGTVPTGHGRVCTAGFRLSCLF